MSATSENPHGWEQVQNKYGTSFFKRIEDPKLGVKGYVRKSLGGYVSPGGYVEKVLSTEHPPLTRTVAVHYNPDGTRSQVHHNMTDLDHRKFSIDTSKSPEYGDGEVMVHLIDGQDKLFITYEPASAAPSEIIHERESQRPRIEDLIRSTSNFGDNLKLLSDIYLDEGPRTFTYRTDSSWDTREIELKQRKWKDDQRIAIDATISALLSSNETVGRHISPSLTGESRAAFLASIKQEVLRILPKDFWRRISSPADVIQRLSVFIPASIASVLQARDEHFDRFSIPSANITFPESNSANIEITNVEKDDTVADVTVPFGKDFLYDQTRYNLSRSDDGRLILATAQLGRKRERTSFYIKDQSQPGEIAASLRSPYPQRWEDALSYLPSVDRSL